MTETLNGWQAILEAWKTKVIPGEVKTPQREFTRVMEEIEEVKQAHIGVEAGIYTPREAADEAIDVIIGMLGYIHVLGFDTENLLVEKMETIYKKYNPVKNGELQENGYSWDEALAIQKEEWNHPVWEYTVEDYDYTDAI